MIRQRSLGNATSRARDRQSFSQMRTPGALRLPGLPDSIEFVDLS